jgi:hypothetical protein
MAGRTVYVVIGMAGIYSDRNEWPARVTCTLTEAQEWVTRLTADTERARREYASMEDAIEEEAHWCIDADDPGTWPERLRRHVAGMLDNRDALNRALYYMREMTARYRVEESTLEASD